MKIALLVVLWLVLVVGIELFVSAAKKGHKHNDDYEEGD